MWGGRSLTVDFELEEITVEGGGGVRWCRLGTHERATVDAKLNSSRPDCWAETYDAGGGEGDDGERESRGNEESATVKVQNERWDSESFLEHTGTNETANGAEVDWTLRLFDGPALVKTSRGTNRFPPGDQWNAFRLLTDFCFTVTRRYGAPPEAG